MSPRALAVAAFALVAALAATGFVLTILSGTPMSLNELMLAVMHGFAVVGFLIALRRPRNAIAWICLGIGLVWALEAVLWGAALYGFAHPGAVPRPDVLGAVGSFVWVPGLLLISFVLLLFPDGHLLSARWKWLAWLMSSGSVLAYPLLLLSQPKMQSWGRPALENPLGLAWPAMDVVAFVFTGLVVLTGFGGSITALVLRYRRSAGAERHQLKWLATAGTAAAALFLMAAVVVEVLGIFGESVALVAVSSFVLIQISIATAVLRYRLYDIDRLISRGVSYVLLVGVLLAIYAGGVLAVQQLLPISGELAVAASTLVVAALFNPLRRRMQAMADRRFNRARYDAQRTVEAFASRLRDEVDLDELHAELVGVVRDSVEPAAVSLWLRREEAQ